MPKLFFARSLVTPDRSVAPLKNRMGILIFNLPGLVIIALAFAIAYGIGALTGRSEEGPLTLFGGLFVLIFDLSYRLLKANGHWFTPSRGGSLFFLPAWMLGALWIVLGIVYTLQQ